MTIKKRIRIAIVVVFIIIIVPCLFHRDYSAKVIGENSLLTGYRVYHSILGNTYIEDNYGSPLIIYSHPRSVTSPEKGAFLFHRDSWIIVDPIRAIFPTDIYLRVSHDPKLELSKNEIKLNIEPQKRITISSK